MILNGAAARSSARRAHPVAHRRRSTAPSSRPTSCGASSTSTWPTPRTASGSAWATAWRHRPTRVLVGLDRDPAVAVRGPRLLLHRPDHQRQLPDRGRVGGGPGAAGQELPGRRERARRRDRARRRRRGRRVARRSRTPTASRPCRRRWPRASRARLCRPPSSRRPTPPRPST